MHVKNLCSICDVNNKYLEHLIYNSFPKQILHLYVTCLEKMCVSDILSKENTLENKQPAFVF